MEDMLDDICETLKQSIAWLEEIRNMGIYLVRWFCHSMQESGIWRLWYDWSNYQNWKYHSIYQMNLSPNFCHYFKQFNAIKDLSTHM